MTALTVAEQWALFDRVDTTFILCAVVFTWPIVPAVGLGYSGYSTRKNGLASFLPSLLVMATVTVQWWAIGYSLAYSPGNAFIGDLSLAFHNGVLAKPVGAIPELLFSAFQLNFCATVGAIVIGGFVQRGRLVATIPFIFLWATFVYCPLAHAVWGGGFLQELGALDYAGGTPVHICSGASATAISVYLSWPLFRSRKSSVRTPGYMKLHKPHNTTSQLLALVIIWSSWLVFDAATTLELNFKSVSTAFVTNLCASSGCITWSLMTYYETGKWSLDSAFLGAISGLVLITPSAGFISVRTSFFFGIAGALICRAALMIKFTKLARRLRWVDNGDSFATHCIGGFFGTVATGLFAQKEVAAYDGVTQIAGGVFFDGNTAQLGIQIVEALFGFTYAFTVSYLIMCFIDSIPGLEVLAKDETIIAGLDAGEMGESLYAAQWDGEEDYHPFSKAAIEI